MHLLLSNLVSHSGVLACYLALEKPFRYALRLSLMSVETSLGLRGVLPPRGTTHRTSTRINRTFQVNALDFSKWLDKPRRRGFL
ncbi:hypothetical protein CK203_110559 [Vitis vinifera]|uniref:Secreted protein n=1 Tax=Vitis vinifera TaxID=29760 RepID=A0A438CQ16_VITVI|nr:hypothetical protein CK203_110559 [Vitis vinifera]